MDNKYIAIDRTELEKIMADKKVLSNSQAWDSVIKQLKSMAIYIPVMLIVLTMTWKTYGEPLVKEIVSREIGPALMEVQRNTANAEEIKFTMAQILLIMEKTTDIAIIEEVKRETERFKPKARFGYR